MYLFQMACRDLCNISQPTVCRVINKFSEKLATKLPGFVFIPPTNVV